MPEIAKLKESKAFLNILFDSMTPGVFLVDPEMKVNHFNHSFLSMFETNKESAMGKRCGNLMGCSYVVEEELDCGLTSNCKNCTLRASVGSSFSTENLGRGVLERDFYIKGHHIPKAFQYTTQKLQYEKREMVIIVLDDITEERLQKNQLRQKNKQLLELNEFKNSFLGMAAHDLRNPIASIQMYSDFLIKPPIAMNEEKRKKFLSCIRDSSQFTLHLLNELLDISKIESGKLDVKFKEIDFKPFLQRIIEINQMIALQKKINIRFEDDHKNLFITIDQNKIEQVLNNLLSNAIKYSPKKSEVKVKMDVVSEWLTISVIDEGPGIPEKEQSILFTQFGKTSVKTTGGEKSTGLGLAISKKIMDAHKGKIGFVSKEGKGSTFYISLQVHP